MSFTRLVIDCNQRLFGQSRPSTTPATGDGRIWLFYFTFLMFGKIDSGQAVPRSPVKIVVGSGSVILS